MTSIAPTREATTTSVQQRLNELHRQLAQAARSQIGYPVNQGIDFSPIIPFLQYSLNNIGDPFHRSNYQSNTHQIEREVILHFAELMRLEPEQAWGYVTSGGTEGNMYGLYLARETYPDGMVYFSEEAHYSVLKNVRVLGIRHTMVKRQPDGEIDYDDLQNMLRVNRDIPAIILATIGSTMYGAIDDISHINRILDDLEIQDRYIHADAALSGMILPYVDNPQPFGFDYGISSVSISGHKLIGTPLPCGVVVTSNDVVEQVGRAIEYVGIHDTTLSGSRSGISPLMLWYAINTYREDGFREMIDGMLETAEYAVQTMNRHGIPAWRHRNSPTVVFPKPSPEVLSRWQIALEGNTAHIITMAHVTHDMIDHMVEDCAITAHQP